MEFNQSVTIWNEFESQLAELKERNKAIYFDYEDPKGNKEARSHVAMLRRTKTAVETRRKELKQAALDYGREIDSQANQVKGEIETMIEVHAAPIKEIEEREKHRQARVSASMMGFQRAAMFHGSIEDCEHILYQIASEEILDVDFQDKYEQAKEFQRMAIRHLEDKLADLRKAEEERLELERLREEKAAREAEEAREREEAARKEREAEEAKLREEREKLAREREENEARLREERDRLAREREELDRQQAEERRRKAEENERAADEERRRRSEVAKREALDEIYLSIKELEIVEKSAAMEIALAIVEGKINRVRAVI